MKNRIIIVIKSVLIAFITVLYLFLLVTVILPVLYWLFTGKDPLAFMEKITKFVDQAQFIKRQVEALLNIVSDNNLLINKGDAIIVKGHGGLTQLIIVCPGCGKASASRGKHIYNRETKSYTPSIVHNTKYGGCGWHGWLTNGIFKEC